MYKTISKEELTKILEDHKLWLSSDGEVGTRANLEGANLIRANLEGADLYGANLIEATLIGANLRVANLSGAYLRRADLRIANLEGANLSGTDLYGASLSDASLSGADLSGASLSGANLKRADLSGANLFQVQGKDILTFQARQHFAYACDGYIKIGCITKTVEEWLKEYKEIGTYRNYSKEEIIMYGDFIKLVSRRLKNVNSNGS